MNCQYTCGVTQTRGALFIKRLTSSARRFDLDYFIVPKQTAKLTYNDIVLQAACLIAEHGIHQLTMRQLARRLSCSVGSLPHYFSGKDEIIEAALDWSNQRILQRVERIDATQATLDTFVPIIKSTLPLTPQAELEWRVRLALWNYASTKQTNSEHLHQRISSSLELLSDWAQLLQASGHIKPELNSEHIAHNVYHLINGLAFSLIHIPLGEREQHLEPIVDFLTQLKPIEVQR